MSLILVTGASGEVGHGVVPYLEREFSLRLLSLDSPSDDSRWVQAELLDWNAVSAALEGVSAVLHLAVATGHSGIYEEDYFNDLRFDVNVKGTFHLFEAARRAGVKRVVYVSSLMVLWGHGSHNFVSGDAPPRPVGTYALTKRLGEQIAEHYARAHGMEVVTVRIAAPFDPETAVGKLVRPQQVPFPDLAQVFARALTVNLPEYAAVTIVGESSRRMWDLEPAKKLLGYEPAYRLDDLGVIFTEPFDVKP
jgi:uronate dehydrogenase